MDIILTSLVGGLTKNQIENVTSILEALGKPWVKAIKDCAEKRDSYTRYNWVLGTRYSDYDELSEYREKYAVIHKRMENQMDLLADIPFPSEVDWCRKLDEWWEKYFFNILHESIEKRLDNIKDLFLNSKYINYKQDHWKPLMDEYDACCELVNNSTTTDDIEELEVDELYEKFVIRWRLDILQYIEEKKI